MDEIVALLQEPGVSCGILSFMNYGETLESIDEKSRWSNVQSLFSALSNGFGFAMKVSFHSERKKHKVDSITVHLAI